MHFYLETERLVLRDLLFTDDAGMFELESDKDVHHYLGRKPVSSIEESRQVIAFIRKQYENNGIGRWAVTEKATGSFIGWAGLKLIDWQINGHVGFHDIGYRFIKRYWGMGFATEAAKATVNYAWNALDLQTVFAFADSNNIASRNVLEKTGMQLINTFSYEGNEHVWYELQKGQP